MNGFGAGELDLLNTDQLTLDPASVLTLTGSAAESGEIVIVNQTGIDPVSGTFANLAPGDVVTLGASYRITYTGGDGNEIALVRDEAPVLVTTPGAQAYMQDAPPVVIDDAITLTDPDDAVLAGASVAVTANFQSGEDALDIDAGLLAAIAGGALTSNTAVAGTLTLSGTASLADYEAALRLVTFQSSSSSGATRTITFSADDGDLTGSATRDLTVAPSNQPPTDILLSEAAVDENAAIGTVVGILDAIDPESGETFTFSEVVDADDKFEIAGNELRVSGALDFESATSHDITIRVNRSRREYLGRGFHHQRERRERGSRRHRARQHCGGREPGRRGGRESHRHG